MFLCFGTVINAQRLEDKKTEQPQPLQTIKLPLQKPVMPVVQPQQPLQPAQQSAQNSKKPTSVILEHADSLIYNQAVNSEAQVLYGNVTFSHEGAFLYCDSAYWIQANNSFIAFGDVLIQQGDTLFVYGDVLYYDGNTKLARLRGNVLMDNLTATLRTDSLNYDRIKNVGYYFNGGILEDSLNVLVSETGYYYPSLKTAVFRNSVELTNPKFVLTTDTLRYNTASKVASIVGPTDILYEKKTHIYSEYGWYNTNNEQSKLLLNSYIQHEDGKKLVADTIFYDKKNGKGEGFSNVHLVDTIKKVSLNGNYGFYFEKDERGVVTDSAVMMEYSSSDTLFLHADTLYTFAQKNIVDSLDTVRAFKDSVYKVFIGYYNVRFFRESIQGVCDSSYFNTKDSVLLLLNKPVTWSDNRQLTGDTIRIFQQEEKLNRVVVNNNAFVTDSVENKFFNQLSGKQIISHIRNNLLYKVDVLGNAESIYFPIDDKDNSLVGMASSVSSIMNIYISNKNDKREIEKIVILPNPKAKIVPISSLTADSKLYLNNYSWKREWRPLSKYDIFRRTADIVLANNSVAETKKENSGKKTTRRDDVKPIDNLQSKKATTSTDNNRPSGFSNPNVGNTGSGNNKTVGNRPANTNKFGGLKR